MKLIDDWKAAWRMWSVQSMAVATAIQGAWGAAPDDMRASLPHEWVQGITIALLVFGIVGRLIEQPKVRQ